mgnify:CR=1 FL=1
MAGDAYDSLYAESVSAVSWTTLAIYLFYHVLTRTNRCSHLLPEHAHQVEEMRQVDSKPQLQRSPGHCQLLRSEP